MLNSLLKKNQIKEILLIEDSQSDVDLLVETFSQLENKNSLNVVMDGEAAVCYLEGKDRYQDRKIPDLIILDYNLPNLDGIEVLKFIKSHQELKVIPVIMMTTSDSIDDIKKAYENHVNCFFSKPKNLKEFIELSSLIDKLWLQTAKLPRNG